MPRKEEAAPLGERGLGTDGASWDLPGTGLEKETLKVKDGFPAKAGLGSVPNPAVGAGREAQASLFHAERDEGGEGQGAGPGWGDSPTSCGFGVQNQPEPPHVPRGSAPGRGWDVQCE